MGPVSEPVRLNKMIVATAGHIDHGKSSLVKALTGVDTDRLPEEKRRGISIDLGFAYVQTPAGNPIAFVDVPGHERFVRNMVSGVTGAGVILLVVAADDGLMPQTLEHLAIIELLALPLGAVVITKCDRVDCERVQAVADLAKKALHDAGLAPAPAFPMSSLTGEGLEAVREYLYAKADGWRPAVWEDAYFRMAVDRSLSIPGHGIVIAGTVFAGSVKEGDSLLLTPSGKALRLRSIQIAGAPVAIARAGERCALNISGPGIARDEIHRGEWVVHPCLHRPSERIEAQIRVLSTEQAPLVHGAIVRFHHGTAATSARVLMPKASPVLPGQSACGWLVLNPRAGILAGDKFVLRDGTGTRTLGGGEVVDPFSASTRDSRYRARVAAMALRQPREVLKALTHTAQGADLDEFEIAFNIQSAAAALLYLELEIVVLTSSGARVGISREMADSLLGGILTAVDFAHFLDRSTPGLPVESLARSLGVALPQGIFAELLRILAADAQLELKHSRVRYAGAAEPFTSGEEELWNQVVALLDLSGPSLPRLKDLAAALATDEVQMQGLLLRKSRAGLLLRISDRLFVLSQTLSRLALAAEEVANQCATAKISVSAFRDHAGLNRNRSVQILEYFDRIRYTRRVGEDRSILRKFQQVIDSTS